MPVNQREVYFLPHPFDPKVPEHPHIVLSVLNANNHEQTFIAVMITTSEHYHDDYSFDLNNSMFEKPLAKEGSHVRMHLLTLALEEDRIGPCKNKMKKFFFDQLMESIGDSVFGFSFKPLS